MTDQHSTGRRDTTTPTGRSVLVSLAVISALTGGACSSNNVAGTSATGDSNIITVASTDTACELSANSASSGAIVFDVTNTGSQVTEFYFLAADGVRIVGEVENIGPGITRKLVTTAQPGTYVTACKPGMKGDGIRNDFTVTGEAAAAPTGDKAEQLATATERYAEFVRKESTSLLAATRSFATAYAAGEADTARSTYAPSRMHWERIEPVAESFGDLDPRLDLREADLEAGQAWTGWHRIEKDLWPPASGYTPLTEAERKAVADQLVADTVELDARISKLTYTADQLGNGAKELLDEVATGKVTGEEEIWSGTDLWDFQANVDGARFAFEVLEPVVTANDPALAATLTDRFAAVQKLLDSHKDGDGFKLYKSLSAEQVKELADAVNALGEPLSNLTATVVL